jgi:hypothetical protein
LPDVDGKAGAHSVFAHFWERFKWVQILMILWVNCCGKDNDG